MMASIQTEGIALVTLSSSSVVLNGQEMRWLPSERFWVRFPMSPSLPEGILEQDAPNPYLLIINDMILKSTSS